MCNHTCSHKSLYYVFIFFVGYSMMAQDSVSISNLITRDHASNRLFWMSTGRISTPKKFFIGNFEVVATQVGYTPSEFLQLDAGFITFFEKESYWSVGAKVQLMKPDEGILQGLAIGTDYGSILGIRKNSTDNYPSSAQTFNIAASLGTRDEQFHINLVGTDNEEGFRTSFQIGSSFELNRPDSPRGMKLMAEFLIAPTDSSSLEMVAGILGFRSYGKVFVGEFAFVFIPSNSSRTGNLRSLLPYFSVMWYF